MFPTGLLDSVAAIGAPSSTTPRGVRWFGTGFMYYLISGELPPETGKGWNGRSYLVTNRHVIDGQNKEQLVVLFHPRGQASASVRIERHMWVAHPDPTVDIAVTGGVQGLLNRDHPEIKLQHILSNQALDTKRLRDLGAGEADQVVVLGFPLGIVDPPAGRPIVRSGVIDAYPRCLRLTWHDDHD